MIHDGLWCPFENWHMGNAGETVADVYKVTRDQQDQYSADSHKKAAAAQASGKFNAEILPVAIPQKKGDPLVFDKDESVRGDTTAEVLRGLKPAFKKDGSVTAGNAPPVNDGAAALVVMAEDKMTVAQRQADRPHRRAGDERPRAEDAADDAGRSDAQGVEESRLVDQRRRPDRAQRSVRGAGGGGDVGARRRSVEGQRQRRRGGARPSDRRIGRAHPDDVDLCVEGSRTEARHRYVVPGRRERRRARHRDR